MFSRVKVCSRGAPVTTVPTSSPTGQPHLLARKYSSRRCAIARPMCSSDAP
jgi:hypothetical protein